MNASTAPARVSVALATYQGAEFVAAQVRSILQQSRPVDEIVLSDDASTDGTVQIVEACVAEHAATGAVTPELVVLRNDPPLRVTQNFAQAIARASGDCIALCDQDDVWHVDRIRDLEAQLAAPGALLVMSNARQVDAAGHPLGHSLFEALAMSPREYQGLASGDAYTLFLRRNLATGATVMFRRELFEMAQPFPAGWLHDEWLALVAAALDGVVMLDEQLTDYRQHGANQVGMERLGFRRKLRMFAEPRTERNARLFQRASVMPARLRAIPGVSGERIAQAEQKFAFEQARQAYPAARARRIMPILRQLRAGRYSKYGTGLKDAVRNLLQPV